MDLDAVHSNRCCILFLDNGDKDGYGVKLSWPGFGEQCFKEYRRGSRG